MARFVVVGLGNTVLGDDGVGVRVALACGKPEWGDDVELLDGGTVGLALLPRLADADGVIFVDAARLEAAPGTVRVVEGAALESFLASLPRSAHDVGLSDLVDALRLTAPVGQLRALVGIQPEAVDWAETLSFSVSESLPVAICAVQNIIEAWS